MTLSRVRVALRLVAALGALLLVAGICWGFVERARVLHVGATVLLAAGTAACLAAVVGATMVERRTWGLVLPAGSRLSAPFWPGPLLLTGLCDVLGGAYASPALLAAGALLVVVALVGAARQLHRTGVLPPSRGFDLTFEPPSRPAGTSAPGLGVAAHGGMYDRGTVIAARRLQDFARLHAVHGDAGFDCLIEHTGRDVARIVAVGRDGAFGDVLVRGLTRAEQAVVLAGAEPHEPASRSTAARIRSGSYEWHRMAGMQLGAKRRAGR